MFDSHNQCEYMHRSHAETSITAGFFGFRLVSMMIRLCGKRRQETVLVVVGFFLFFLRFLVLSREEGGVGRGFVCVWVSVFAQ